MKLFIFGLLFGVCYLPFMILYPTKILHKERLKKGKAILTSNHYSNVDAILINMKFGARFRFLAKIELFKSKFMGYIMRCLGAIPVDRQKMTPSTYKEVMSVLKEGKKVFIFPEGTRNKEDTEKMNDAKAGVIMFASKGDAEIVPMLIYRKPKIFRKNYIIVGEAFKVQGENPARLTKQETEENLEIYTQRMNELRAELDQIVSSKKNNKTKGKNNGCKN